MAMLAGVITGKDLVSPRPSSTEDHIGILVGQARLFIRASGGTRTLNRAMRDLNQLANLR
jgi:hypothetical protein